MTILYIHVLSCNLRSSLAYPNRSWPTCLPAVFATEQRSCQCWSGAAQTQGHRRRSAGVPCRKFHCRQSRRVWHCGQSQIESVATHSLEVILQSKKHRFILCGSKVCLLVGCITSQQHTSVSQGRICLDNLTCCHTETEVADQTFHLTQSQYTDTGPTSPSTDPLTPGRVATGVPFFKSLVWQDSGKNPGVRGIRTRDLPLSKRTP